jgi:hypothetical protein
MRPVRAKGRRDAPRRDLTGAIGKLSSSTHRGDALRGLLREPVLAPPDRRTMTNLDAVYAASGRENDDAAWMTTGRSSKRHATTERTGVHP